MRRLSLIALIAVGALSLAGCEESQTWQEAERDRIQIGKECAEEGGVWSWSDWSGWNCEFGVTR